MSEKGFTIIELVMVIVLTGILAAIASSMIFGGTSSIGVGAMAELVRDDVRYAQGLAMRRTGLDTAQVTNPSFRYRIRFNVTDADCNYTNQYTIVNDADNNGTWGENPNGAGAVESARRPSTGAPYFCVQFDSGDYKGFAVTADFGGAEPGTLEFDVYGVPYDSDGVALAVSKSITIAKDGNTAALTVEPNTGHVALQ